MDDPRATVDDELVRREREIARLSRLYAALGRIHHELVAAPAREPLLAEVCRVLVEVGGFRMSWIGLRDPSTDAIVPVASAGDDTGDLEQIASAAELRPEALREGRPYVCNDLRADAHPFRASAAFPFRNGETLLGTVNVYADEPGFFRDQEIALLGTAAADLSFALDRLDRDRSLRAERDFSAALIRSLPGVVYVYDEQRRFLRWNDNFARVIGYSADEISRLDPLSLFGDQARPVVAARIAEVFATGASSVEEDLVAKDGAATRYYFTGVLAALDDQTCLVGVGIDVSARDRAEASYRRLFDYAPDGIVIADARSYYLDANLAACRMLGYARAELIGKHASDIVVATDLPRIEGALDAIVAGADYRAEWSFRRKDGTVFPADVIATMMPDGSLLAMIRDVSARKQAEQALRAMNESLERRVSERTHELQAARVRAEAADRIKSAFLATMSHELRTPLNSIIGFTSILLQELPGPLNQEQTTQLGMVRDSGRHLLELINDVLDISKIEADQLEIHPAPFDLRGSIERVVATIAPLAAAKQLAIQVDLAELADFVSDRRRVEQIVINLLNNAIKFTDQGTVTLTATHDGAGVQVRVTDTGIGIRAEDLAKLFQPFHQLESGLARRHEGTGLGLAICRRLATLLDGDLSVTSTFGAGSTFTLTLPAAPRA